MCVMRTAWFADWRLQTTLPVFADTYLPHRRHLPASVKDVRNIFQMKIGVDSPSRWPLNPLSSH
jgi:hypothetical protein